MNQRQLFTEEPEKKEHLKGPQYPPGPDYKSMCPKKDICPGVTGDTKQAIYPIYCHYLLCPELLGAIKAQGSAP